MARKQILCLGASPTALICKWLGQCHLLSVWLDSGRCASARSNGFQCFKFRRDPDATPCVNRRVITGKVLAQEIKDAFVVHRMNIAARHRPIGRLFAATG